MPGRGGEAAVARQQTGIKRLSAQRAATVFWRTALRGWANIVK
jgi:hypothetical protein